MSNTDFAQLLANSEGLTEQFKTDASQLFEQAVETRVGELINEKLAAAVDKALAEQLADRLEDQRKELAEQLAEKASEFVEEELADRLEDQRKELAEQLAEKASVFVEEELADRVEEKRKEIVEEFSVKFNTLIEEKEQLEEQVESRAAELCAEKVGELRDRLAGYADYVAEKYVTDNTDSIVEQTKVTVADGILESIRDVLAHYGVGATEAAEGLQQQIDKLTAERDQAYENLAEAVEAKFDLERQLTEQNKNIAFDHLTESLTDLDRNRIKTLVENDGSDLETFKSRVKTLAESFAVETNKQSAPAVSTVNVVTESAPVESKEQNKVIEESVDPDVDFFFRALNAGKGDHY